MVCAYLELDSLILALAALGVALAWLARRCGGRRSGGSVRRGG